MSWRFRAGGFKISMAITNLIFQMGRFVIHLSLGGLVVAAVLAFSLAVAEAETSFNYGFSDRGGISVITRGGTGAPTTGYARIQPNASNPTPSGLAIFGLRQGGVLVSESGVPASPLIQAGRIYAEISGPVNTGIAIANPSTQAVTLSFHFTDVNGVDFGNGTHTIVANSQIAAFLNEPPFNGGNLVAGTFTFS